MTEQIYINGVQMDTQSGKSVSLIFQSPYFTDIDSIVSNRTTAVDLPNTPNNLRAIEQANLESRETIYAYNKHRVVYIRDGVQIFSGLATLQSLTPASLRFSFTWGNVSAFQQLLDTNLRDLQTAEDYVGYDDDTASTDRRHYPAGWNERKNWGGVAALSIQPIMPVVDIMNRIRQLFGITMALPTTPAGVKDDPDVFARYRVPLVSRNADNKSLRGQGVTVRGHHTQVFPGLFGAQLDHPCVLRVVGGLIRDPRGLFDSATYDIDVSEIDRVTVRIAAGFSFTSKTQIGGLVVVPVGDVFYYSPITVLRAAETREDGLWRYTFETDVVKTFDVSGTQYLALVADVAFNTNDPGALSGGAVRVLGDIDVYDPDWSELVFGRGAVFPLYRNLPDWTVSQFLKNLMQIEGLFAIADGDKAIRFVGIGDIYKMRSQALDLTDRLVLTDGAPEEVSSIYGNYARMNWCRYAKDETVTGDFDGCLRVDNEALERETDLITSDFAPTEGGIIKVWTYESEPDEAYDAANWSFTDVEPRILWDRTGPDGSTVATFSGLSWASIIATKYGSYQSMILRPRALKATVRVTISELQQLDFTRPVYARQWGRYYAVMKLTTGNSDLANVELLRLGRAPYYSESSSPDETPVTPDIPGTTGYRIAAEPNGDGTYRIALVGGTTEQVATIVNSPDYHLCLIRRGYTRRGESGRKRDPLYGYKQATTTRDRTYREFRKGLTWRIIGHEILQRGSLSPTSQAAQSERYRGATLVFEFGQTVKLPAMASTIKGKANLVTSRGRIRNSSAGGLAELYVALFKRTREGNNLIDRWGWECVSNRLQVRGRSSDFTKYWEFDKSNLKGV